MALDYPVLMTPDDNGTLLVTCPDLPGHHPAATRPTRCAMRATPSKKAIAARIARRADIPFRPRHEAGRRQSRRFSMIARRAPPDRAQAVHRAMRAQNLRKADLGGASACTARVDRLLNPPRLAPRPDRAALAAVGKRLVVDVERRRDQPESCGAALIVNCLCRFSLRGYSPASSTIRARSSKPPQTAVGTSKLRPWVSPTIHSLVLAG
jgi:antitoxin HicB